ncbi:MAG: DegV family protein [Bacillota bacterium]
MKKIGIVTDSAANLPAEIVEHGDIKIIPMRISFARRTYLDGVDLTAGDFYDKIQESEHLPVIEPPTSGEFCEIFESMKEEGYEGAVCILMSNNIFPSFNAACEARNLVRPFPVVVVDSHTASMNQGFMVLEAMKAADAGLSIPEVVESAWKLRPGLHFYGMVGMLHYLVRARRLGKFSAFLRALFNYKPVVTIDGDDGRIKPVTRVKSRDQCFRFFIQEIEKLPAADGKLHVAVLHADETAAAQELFGLLKERFKDGELYLLELTPAVGFHTGPGLIGVSFYRG